MKITKLVTIKNYVVEDRTTMPVVLVENLEETIGGKTPMKYMICTLHLTSGAGDTEGLPEYVIAVNKKFLRLRNKNQLALIALENEKMLQSQYDFETNKGVEFAAKAEVIAIYGKYRFNRANNKITKYEKKSLMKATAGAHRQYKKDLKSIAKLGQAANGLDDFVDDDDDEVIQTNQGKTPNMADVALNGAVNVVANVLDKVKEKDKSTKTSEKGETKSTPAPKKEESAQPVPVAAN